jgi:hypothetical protein
MGTTGANTLALGQWNQATFFSFFNGAVFIKLSDVSDTALDSDLTRVTPVRGRRKLRPGQGNYRHCNHVAHHVDLTSKIATG